MAKNELDDFLGDLKNENTDDPFILDAEDPLGEPATSNEEPEEKPLPFNKDPKIQKFIQKEVERLSKDLRPTEVQTFIRDTGTKQDDTDEVLSSLTEIVGNDTPQKIAAVARLRKALASEKDESVKRAVAELESLSTRQQEEEQEEFAEAQDELVQGFESIEDTYGVDLLSEKGKNLRGEFIDFIKRVAPKDEDGEVIQYPDFEETFKLFRDTRKAPSNNRAKEIASRSIARSSDASAVKATGNSWKDVEKIFNKLSK